MAMSRQLSNIPVLGVGYSIQQQKAPLYGYNDVGPRRIMNGQRLVSGDFAILHKSAGYLEDILTNRAEMPYGTMEKLDMKESLKLQYWNRRDWDSTMNDPQRAGMNNKRNLFYAHPSFDISIIYGTGDEVGRPAATEGKLNLTNVLSQNSEWHNDVMQPQLAARGVNPLYKDITSVSKQRETIVGVQLVGKSKSISIDGEVVMESYSFLAIDVLNQ
jgi:hypothetical protein